MVTSAVIIILLTIVASLASWLFSQWLARRARVSGLALAVGGVGTVLLLGAVALVMVTASTSWQQLMPIADASPLRHEMLAPAEAIIPAAVVAEWPATDCVESMRAEESAHWILDNGCDRIVAVLFASCQLSETACFSQGWQYEATGILMTAETDRPLALRLGDNGPLVAPLFTIRDAAGVRRQIRYLACEVTAPGVLRLLTERSEQLTSERLTADLRADACYSQVLEWSRSGHRLGASPDALLRRGIN
jgi:hypothetical protein